VGGFVQNDGGGGKKKKRRLGEKNVNRAFPTPSLGGDKVNPPKKGCLNRSPKKCGVTSIEVGGGGG